MVTDPPLRHPLKVIGGASRRNAAMAHSRYIAAADFNTDLTIRTHSTRGAPLRVDKQNRIKKGAQ